jgi:F-type H+-transporting ATPase subunit b
VPHWLYEAELWVAVAFAVFLIVVFRFGVHRSLLGMLDQRGAKIQAELDEAKRLKDEAEKLLAEYKRKAREAEGEAQAIIAAANTEAKQIAADAKTRLEEFVARRTKMAETKIAQAEQQAMTEVRAAAADAAVKAAETIVAETAKGAEGKALLETAIKDVKSRLG